MTVKYPTAKEKAEELRNKYALPVPVHIFELADLIGIKWNLCDTTQLTKIVEKQQPEQLKTLQSYQPENVLAFYDKPANTFFLNNSNQPITRKRFTMAHEIGHHLLHNHLSENHYRKVFVKEDIVDPKDQIEKEANYFAGYLLMPDDAIEQKLRYTSIMLGGENIIQELAKMFAVSPDAMRIRLRTFKQEHPEVWDEYHLSEKLF